MDELPLNLRFPNNSKDWRISPIICGGLGTILVGFFAQEGGMFYGGGVDLLVTQIIGVAAIAAWALVCGFILFKVIKSTIGLRVSKRVEEEGLDIYEHGEQAYE